MSLRDLCVKTGQFQCWTFLYQCLTLFLSALPAIYVNAGGILQGEIGRTFLCLNQLSYISALAEYGAAAVDKVGFLAYFMNSKCSR